MSRVNVSDYIKKNGLNFYKNLLEEEEKQIAKALVVRAEHERLINEKK
ncbi:hypothetical protein AB4Z45_03425 [Paenibacillus sp. MCAF9]